MEITLARIKAIAGETRVGSPVLRNTHHPDAFQMQKFSPSEETLGARTSLPHSALRRFRPAIPARVEVKDAVPVFVTFRNQRHKVLAQAGPWRNSGDWWSETSWARDEWDVTLTENIKRAHKMRPFETVSSPESAVYRIYCDLHTQQWFVEGVYD